MWLSSVYLINPHLRGGWWVGEKKILTKLFRDGDQKLDVETKVLEKIWLNCLMLKSGTLQIRSALDLNIYPRTPRELATHQHVTNRIANLARGSRRCDIV